MTISVTIKSKKAKKLLEDLASLDIIEIHEMQKEDSASIRKHAKKEKTLTHLASERSLAKTWDNAEEEEAWKDL